MRFDFSQCENCRISVPDGAVLPELLLNAIHSHTDLRYSWEQTANGFFLKPRFREIPYRNSFLPELTVTVSREGDSADLQITGRPVNYVRIGVQIWIICVLLFWIPVLVGAAASAWDSIIPVLIPPFMAVFAYLLCKLGMLFPFRSVINAIEKAYP